MNLYIDIAISLILIFLVFSVIVYVLQELIAARFNNRGKMLWRALAQVLDGALFKDKRAVGKKGLKPGQYTPFTNLFFNHPQIQALQKDPDTAPSYIPASNFTVALLELVAKQAAQPTGNLLTDFSLGLAVLAGQNKYAPPKLDLASHEGAAIGGATAFSGESPVVAILQSLVMVSPSLGELQKNTEKWYNDYMNRVTGWYQTRTVLTVRWLAVGVTLFFNLNCIQLVRDIADDSVLRNNLVGISMHVVDHPEIVTGLMDQRFKTDSANIAKRYDSLIVHAKNDSAKQALQQELENKQAVAVDSFTKQRVDSVRSLINTLTTARLAFGWGCDYVEKELLIAHDGKYAVDVEKAALALLGWLITAYCLSMGAPFWFNLLMQLVNVRRAGIKPKDDATK